MVGVVILNYNNVKDTLNCVESVLQFNTYPIKIVIVDNGSTNPYVVPEIDSYLSHKYLDQYERIDEGTPIETLNDITFLVSLHNDGYAQGNNKGLNLLYRDSDIKYILILNSDILFVEDIISRLVEDLQSVPNGAIVSPVLHKKDMNGIDYNCARRSASLMDLFIEYLFLFHDFGNLLSKRRKKRNLLIDKKLPLEEPLLEIELPSGSCMLVDKVFFKSIGAFDSHTFLYNEEDILWVKIHRLGKKNYLDTRLRCIHLGATTIDNKAPSEFVLNCSLESNYYYLENYTNAGKLYLFCMKVFHCGIRLKWKIRQLLKKREN